MEDKLCVLLVASERHGQEFLRVLGATQVAYEIIIANDLEAAAAALTRRPIPIAVVDVRGVQQRSDLDPALHFFRRHPGLLGILSLAYYEGPVTGELFQQWPSGIMVEGVYTYLWRPWYPEGVRRLLERAADAVRQGGRQYA
ncbi:hypothetical protein HYW17_05350 [Candidatus Uhrbacteria bacterium]|nr:hypothetical protein [Candidatus Uhrbacteria bacterium]